MTITQELISIIETLKNMPPYESEIRKRLNELDMRVNQELQHIDEHEQEVNTCLLHGAKAYIQYLLPYTFRNVIENQTNINLLTQSVEQYEAAKILLEQQAYDEANNDELHACYHTLIAIYQNLDFNYEIIARLSLESNKEEALSAYLKAVDSIQKALDISKKLIDKDRIKKDKEYLEEWLFNVKKDAATTAANIAADYLEKESRSGEEVNESFDARLDKEVGKKGFQYGLQAIELFNEVIELTQQKLESFANSQHEDDKVYEYQRAQALARIKQGDIYYKLSDYSKAQSFLLDGLHLLAELKRFDDILPEHDIAIYFEALARTFTVNSLERELFFFTFRIFFGEYRSVIEDDNPEPPIIDWYHALVKSLDELPEGSKTLTYAAWVFTIIKTALRAFKQEKDRYDSPQPIAILQELEDYLAVPEHLEQFEETIRKIDKRVKLSTSLYSLVEKQIERSPTNLATIIGEIETNAAEIATLKAQLQMLLEQETSDTKKEQLEQMAGKTIAIEQQLEQQQAYLNLMPAASPTKRKPATSSYSSVFPPAKRANTGEVTTDTPKLG